MNPATSPAFWRTVGCSIPGATHRRRQLPNQDAISCLPANGCSPVAIVSIADGHGSSACFRSGEGAALAVSTATELLQSCAPDLAHDGFEAFRQQLTDTLVNGWRSRVSEHLQANPLDHPATEPWTIYGSTVLAVLATPGFVLYLQLGDGDIVTVDDHGRTSRPIARDERLLGIETTSLCSPSARDEVRVAFGTELPRLLLLSTDGYANSFTDDDGFLQAGSDLLRLLRDDGVDAVRKNLGGWLTETSELGSGDDITVAILERVQPEECAS
jgi:hypothetical protein